MENRYKYVDELDENGKPQHLHTLDGKALQGTSTVTKVIAKPLTWWASGLAVETLGWKNPKKLAQEDRIEHVKQWLKEHKEYENPEDWIKLLDKAYRAHNTKLDKSADDGTHLHEMLEKLVKEGEKAKIDWEDERIIAFKRWTALNVKRFLFSEWHCYSEQYWIGGISDLIFEDREGKVAIMDFKSAKEAYVEHAIQIAGYDIQLKENGVLDRDGNLIYKPKRNIDYYSVFPFGAENPEPVKFLNTEELQKGFLAALTLHKIKQNYG